MPERNGIRLVRVPPCNIRGNIRVTEMPKPSGDQKPTRAELEQQLDEALKQTFPASDPVTIGEPTALVPDRPADRQAPLLDSELVNELAAHLEKSMAAKRARSKAPQMETRRSRSGR